MGRSVREMGSKRERAIEASAKQKAPEKKSAPTYSEAQKTAREIASTFENKAAQAKIAAIREAIHGDATNVLGVPKVTSVDRGYANAVNEQAKASIQKEYTDLGNEVGLSVPDLKMLEAKYDRLSEQDKADAGLPKYFDQITTTAGKKPPTSSFGKFLSRFSGASARAELFDKARNFVTSNDPDRAPLSDFGHASAQRKITKAKEALHGEGVIAQGISKTATIDRGYAEATNEQAKASIQREYKDLSSEVGVSVSDLKTLEGKYDRFSDEEKASVGLPKYFDQIAITAGKKPPTSSFGKFLSKFSGASARETLFDKARDFIVNNDPDSLANPEGGVASSKFSAGKKQGAKIDRSGMGGPQ